MTTVASDKVIEWTRVIPTRIRLCVTLMNSKTGELYDGVYELSRQDNLEGSFRNSSYQTWVDSAIADAIKGLKGGLPAVGNVEQLIELEPPILEDKDCAGADVNYLAECRAADEVGQPSHQGAISG